MIDVRLALLVFGLVPTLLAQHSSGALVSRPLSLIPAPNTLTKAGAPVSAREVFVKQTGYKAASKQANPQQPNTPDFTFAKLFKGAEPTAPDIQIAALSLGLDWVPTDGSGNASGTGGWAIIVFTVSPMTAGETGGVIAREAAEEDGASADVFTNVLRDSSYPASMIGVTDRAFDSPELDLYFPGSPTASAQKGDLSAVDGYMGLYGLDSGVRNQLPGVMAGTMCRVYFTVGGGMVNVEKVPAAWWGVPNNKSPATILQTTWTAGGPAWSVPTVFKAWHQLGLTSAMNRIDGLAISTRQNRVLFSLGMGSPDLATWSQLTWIDFSATTPTLRDYSYATDVSVAKSLGVGDTGDIQDMCLDDPRAATEQGLVFGGFLWGGAIQNPYLSPPLISASLSACGYRSLFGANDGSLEFHMVGWPSDGPSPAAFFFLNHGGGGPWPYLAFPVTRNLGNPIPGDPVSLAFQLPGYATNFTLGVQARGFFATLGATSFGVSHIVSINL